MDIISILLVFLALELSARYRRRATSREIAEALGSRDSLIETLRNEIRDRSGQAQVTADVALRRARETLKVVEEIKLSTPRGPIDGSSQALLRDDFRKLARVTARHDDITTDLREQSDTNDKVSQGLRRDVNHCLERLGKVSKALEYPMPPLRDASTITSLLGDNPFPPDHSIPQPHTAMTDQTNPDRNPHLTVIVHFLGGDKTVVHCDAVSHHTGDQWLSLMSDGPDTLTTVNFNKDIIEKWIEIPYDAEASEDILALAEANEVEDAINRQREAEDDAMKEREIEAAAHHTNGDADARERASEEAEAFADAERALANEMRRAEAREDYGEPTDG